MIDAVEPLERNGGGSVLRNRGVELASVGVDGLLPILAHDAVAGNAELSSSLSLSSPPDLSPGAGQSARDPVAEWYEATVASFGLGVKDELEDCEGSGGRPRTAGFCEYGSYGAMCSCRWCFL